MSQIQEVQMQNAHLFKNRDQFEDPDDFQPKQKQKQSESQEFINPQSLNQGFDQGKPKKLDSPHGQLKNFQQNPPIQNQVQAEEDTLIEKTQQAKPYKATPNNGQVVALPDNVVAAGQKGFGISKEQLVNIMTATQNRTFAQEIDLIQSLIGNDQSVLQHHLKTDFLRGVDDNQESLTEREEIFGHNRKPEIPPKTIWALICEAMKDFTLQILVVAAFVSIIIEVAVSDDDHRSIAWIEGFAIFCAVLVSVSVSAINDYQKEKQFQVLNKVADGRKQVTLIRNGQKIVVHQSLVLVGDICELMEGMEIPADGFLIEGAEITTDESAMTGETDPIKKEQIEICIEKRDQILKDGQIENAGNHDVPSPMIMSGTRILSGEGKYMITVVGDSSCIGKINAILRSQEEEATPLQQKLEAIARDIGYFGLYSAILILVALLLRFFIERGIDNYWDHSKHWGEMLGYFIIAVTVVVVAIPEGLPLSVTLSLAYSVKKMLVDQNLVRKLQACETMGGANMICSDKTGTLTQNKMTLTCFWNDKTIPIDTYSSKLDLNTYIPKGFQELFIQSCICNSSAALRPKQTGNRTEIAILEFLDKTPIRYEEIREKTKFLHKFPFSSKRKRMGCIIEFQNDFSGAPQQRLLVKGASEMVLESCTTFHHYDGSIIQINDSLREIMDQAIVEMAKQALRTIVLAYKDLKGNEDVHSKDDKGVHLIEKTNLTLVSIFGIKDILRKEVEESVMICRKAGIKVRMVTGDNKLTAQAIAKECKIIDPQDTKSLVMLGADFIEQIGGVVCKKCKTQECNCPRDKETAKREKKEIRIDTIANAEVFDKIYPHLDVLARSRPEDKYALVTGLIERGHVVAVTGDGTNDAPALKKADVGFAMGIAGTEVAREAAAIILLDDNFSSIVKAAMWGRNIYDSIRKFLQFQLTVNVVAVCITLVGALVLKQSLLKAIQMLWINLIMDTLASLALATEPPSIELLNRKPHNRNDYIISRKMTKHIIGQSIYQMIIIFILAFGGDSFLPEYKDDLDDEIAKVWLSNPEAIKKYKPFMNSQNLWHIKYSSESQDVMRSGRLYNYANSDPDYDAWKSEFGPSRQFTFIFNTFVWLQIFNFLNARKIFDERNILDGITKNNMFIYIVGLIIALQIILISFTGRAFDVYMHGGSTYFGGLHPIQWIICIAFGFGSIIVSFILKFIPETKFCPQLGVKEADPYDQNRRVLSIKRSLREGTMSRRFSHSGRIQLE